MYGRDAQYIFYRYVSFTKRIAQYNILGVSWTVELLL